MKRIAVKILTPYSVTELKTEALYFDQIHFDLMSYQSSFRFLLGLFDAFKKHSNKAQDHINGLKSSIANIEFLIDKKVLHPVNPVHFLKAATMKDDLSGIDIPIKYLLGADETESKHFIDALRKVFDLLCLEYGTKEVLSFENEEEITKHIVTMNEQYAIRAKVMALTSAADEPNDLFIPVFADFTSMITSPRVLKEREVMNLILEKFPIPETDVAWEDIIAFREDESCRDKLSDLRRWIRTIASTSFNMREVEEEIEYLLRQYENGLKAHKIKFHHKTLELMVTTPLEILENLVKLNWSRIAKSFFQLKQNQIDFITEEKKLPGKEVAFIHQAKSQFSTD